MSALELLNGPLVQRNRVDSPLERRIVRLDAQAKLGAALRVLVPVVHDRVIRQLAQVGESGVHLLWRALEEPPAPGEEERVAIISQTKRPAEDAHPVKTPRWFFFLSSMKKQMESCVWHGVCKHLVVSNAVTCNESCRETHLTSMSCPILNVDPSLTSVFVPGA